MTDGTNIAGAETAKPSALNPRDWECNQACCQPLVAERLLFENGFFGE